LIHAPRELTQLTDNVKTAIHHAPLAQLLINVIHAILDFSSMMVNVRTTAQMERLNLVILAFHVMTPNARAVLTNVLNVSLHIFYKITNVEKIVLRDTTQTELNVLNAQIAVLTVSPQINVPNVSQDSSTKAENVLNIVTETPIKIVRLTNVYHVTHLAINVSDHLMKNV
jgi:hypothetical protein